MQNGGFSSIQYRKHYIKRVALRIISRSREITGRLRNIFKRNLLDFFVNFYSCGSHSCLYAELPLYVDVARKLTVNVASHHELR